MNHYLGPTPHYFTFDDGKVGLAVGRHDLGALQDDHLVGDPLGVVFVLDGDVSQVSYDKLGTITENIFDLNTFLGQILFSAHRPDVV